MSRRAIFSPSRRRPGTVVRREWRVRVAESLGPQKVEVPDTVGVDERVAALKLRRVGLAVGATAHLPYADAAGGHGAGAGPAAARAGHRGAEHQPAGGGARDDTPDGFVMPDFTGMPIVAAQATMAAGGLEGTAADVCRRACARRRRREHDAQAAGRAGLGDRAAAAGRRARGPEHAGEIDGREVAQAVARTAASKTVDMAARPPRAADGSTTPRNSSAGLSHAWRALRHRNFRLFFGGQSISLIGTWMTRVATSWLVYRLTKSSLLLGTVGFAGQIPTFLLAPLAGVIVDRIDRRKVLVWTQALAMVQSLALAWLTLSHRITITEVLVLSAMQGVINAFDMPGRQSFMIRMVEDRADLSNAIAINSSMVNAARLIGPSLAGLLIAATSEGWCFLVDGVSYIAVIASLLMMRVATTRRSNPARP